jgi:hypothetical protein
MAHSGKKRHRDIEPGFRTFDVADGPAAARTFRITEAERQQVAESLRYIDAARRALESHNDPDNREIIRELRASADRIYHLMNDLEETD